MFQFSNLLKQLTALSILKYNIQCKTNNEKTINEKDLITAINDPKYFGNSIILLNQFCNSITSKLNVKHLIYNGEFNGYDLIAINQYRCLLLKIYGEEDYLKLLNFFTPLKQLDDKQIAINLIDTMNAKIVLTYIPQNVETINKFDTFKQRNYKDPSQLEEQFRELRYLDYNREAQYYIIRDQNVAQQFNMSNNDIGEVYVLKATSNFNAKESSFFCGNREYCMNRIEADPNIECADALKQTRQYTSLSSLYKQSKEIPIQQLNLQKFLQRLTLISNDYVNYVQNKQQMDSQLLIYKQLGVEKILLYHNELDEKIIRKLVNVKKSLNTEEQSKLGILYSDNIDLLQSYFGLVSNGISYDIRLLDLNSKQESNMQFNYIQQDTQQQDQYKNCKRYIYNNKVTFNRLKQFLQQQQQTEYYEKTNVRLPLEQIPIMTGSSIKLSGNDLIYFYKPNCAACHTLSETMDRIITQVLNPNPFKIKNMQNFKKINIFKYNILNESELLPSPIQAPQIYSLKDGQLKYADLMTNHIDPSDDAKVYHFLTKFIDNL